MNIKKIISIICAVIMLVSLLANCFVVSAYTAPSGNENKNQTSLSMLNYYTYDGKNIDVGLAQQDGAYFVSDKFSVLSNLTISGWVGHYRGVKSYIVSITCNGEKEILPSNALNASFRALTDEEFALACESVYMVNYNSQGNEKYKFNIDLTKSKFYGSGKDVIIKIDAIIGTGFEANIVWFNNVHLTLLSENCIKHDFEVSSKCSICGYECEHPVEIKGYYPYTYEEKHHYAMECNDCGEQLSSSVVENCVFVDGVCSLCNDPCQHDDTSSLVFAPISDNTHKGYIDCNVCKKRINTDVSECNFSNDQRICVCGNHLCLYDQAVPGDDYLMQSPTCSRPALYYYSCTCGAKTPALSEYFVGEYGDHTYEGGICTICGAEGSDTSEAPSEDPTEDPTEEPTEAPDEPAIDIDFSDIKVDFMPLLFPAALILVCVIVISSFRKSNRRRRR